MKITIKKLIKSVSVGDIVVEKTTLGDDPIFGIVIEAFNQGDKCFNVLVLDTDLYGRHTFYVNHHNDLTEAQLLEHYDIVADADDVFIDVKY